MKHPVLKSRMWLIAWWLVWLLITTGQSLIFYFAYGDYSDFLIYEGLFSLFIFSVIAFSIWYPFNFFNSGTIKLTTLISNLTVSGIISIGLWIILTRLFVTLILTNNSDYLLFRNNTLPYRIGLGIFIYGLVILTYYLYVNMVNLSEKKSQEARLENLVTETELKMLQSQINPHFLFNSLNSISSLTMTDPEKARIMIVKLSEFMRYALSEKEDQQVSFKSELENLRLYLDIEKVRFGEKLTCEESVENNCLDVKMPVMLLQPLYENAVKHGVYESTQSVRIKTVAGTSDNFLRIAISNNYEPDYVTAKGTGTGLQNVKRRLELTYGNRSSFKTSSGDGIFTAEIYIPVSYPPNR